MVLQREAESWRSGCFAGLGGDAKPWAAVSTGMQVLDTVGCDHLDGRQNKHRTWQLFGKSERFVPFPAFLADLVPDMKFPSPAVLAARISSRN